MSARMLGPWALVFGLWALVFVGCAGQVAPAAPDATGASAGAALYTQGLAQAQAGDLTRAEQYFASALRAGHDERASTRALVSVCVRASRLRSALSYANSYLATHPADYALRRLLGTLHFALGEPAQAARELEQALALAPDDAHTHFLLGVVLAVSERRAEAPAHYARYLALAPDGRHVEEAREALRQAAQAQLSSAPVRRARPGRAR
jgi:tetratricopeptide (TPR) repeat protein